MPFNPEDFQPKKFYIFDSLPTLDKCCFCTTLKNGCIIIAAVYSFYILEAFLGSMFSNKYSRCFYTGGFATIIGCSAGLIGLITAVTTILFCYGVHTENNKYFVPFMYTTVMLFAFNLATSILSTFTRSCDRPYLFGGATFAGAVLLLYCLLIVNSYYKYLEDTEDTPTPGPSNEPSPASTKTSSESLASASPGRESPGKETPGNETPGNVTPDKRNTVAATNTDPIDRDTSTNVPSFISPKKALLSTPCKCPPPLSKGRFSHGEGEGEQ